MSIGPIDALALSSLLYGRIVACDRRSGVQVTLAMLPGIRLLVEFFSGMFDRGSPAVASARGRQWFIGDIAAAASLSTRSIGPPSPSAPSARVAETPGD